MDRSAWIGCLAALVCGCAGKAPLVLIPMATGIPDTPENRTPLLRGDLAGPAEDVWVREGDNVRPIVADPKDADGKPRPVAGEPYVRVLLDGKAAQLDPNTGHWVVSGRVTNAPTMRYDLSAAAGKLERLIIVVSEYRSGQAEPEGEFRVLAGEDLPPGAEFMLNRPGKGVRIRTAAGDSVESIELKPGTTYLAWLQVQTTGRREGKPWPWPQVRFRTADLP